jgi:hypothetical protein
MSVIRFQQISLTLHFYDNTDLVGLSMDFLHKICPLLEILKRTLGCYGDFDSKFSFNEATVACFSQYARCLISFNPKKPTGECRCMQFYYDSYSFNVTKKFSFLYEGSFI